jgi:hypothetical protein
MKVYTSLAKTVFLLGSVASLVGGVADSPVTVKANASVNVNVAAKAAVDVSLGSKAKAKSKAKTAAKSTAGTKKTTKAGAVKGHKTMKTINTGNTNVWYKASSLLGE